MLVQWLNRMAVELNDLSDTHVSIIVEISGKRLGERVWVPENGEVVECLLYHSEA